MTAKSDQKQAEFWVAEYGNLLYRYALPRLNGDVHAAEDAVQETFLAALSARKTFSGRSAESTWLTGILKHKIIDRIRKDSRLIASGETLPDDPLDDRLFDSSGRWRTGLKAWQSRPDEVLEQKEFMDTLNSCIEKLPKQAGLAFGLKEMDDQPSAEVCKVLNVTSTNLWVLLHRARIRLQECLERNWFHSEMEKTADADV